MHMMLDAGLAIHNKFEVEVRDCSTKKLRQKAYAYNVLLDRFWSAFPGFTHIHYGNGTGTPSPADTRLFGTDVAVSATQDTYGTNWTTGVCYRRKYIVLSETTSVGFNITEVGVGGSAATALATHAMLQDMNGNPVSILKTDTDIITIYATVYAEWDINGYDNGKSWMYRDSLPLDITNLTMPGISSPNLIGAGTWIRPGTTVNTYDANTRTRHISLARLPVGDGNFAGGIYGMEIGWGLCLDLRGEYQVTNEPVGTGDSVTTDFALQYEYLSQGTVYVDGIALTSGYTLYAGPSLDPFIYFDKISPYSTPAQHIKIGMGTYGGDSTVCFFNPNYAIGLASISASRYVSDMRISPDMVNWVQALSGGSSSTRTYNVPAAYRHWPYIYVGSSGGSSYNWSISATWPDDYLYKGNKVLHFDVPPPAGAVITIDYRTPMIPNDANHVLDVAIDMQYSVPEGNN